MSGQFHHHHQRPEPEPEPEPQRALAVVAAVAVAAPVGRCRECPVHHKPLEKERSDIFTPSKKKTYSQQVFDSTVRVEERSTHRTVDITPGEAHCLHLGHSTLSSRAHGQRGGVAKGGLGTGLRSTASGGGRGSRRRSRGGSSRCWGWGSSGS